MKHQFKVLPIRIYSYKNQYYVINLRKLMLTSYVIQKKIITLNIFLAIFISTITLFIVIVFAIIIYMIKQKRMVETGQ
jgi:hypothetical protein